MSSLSLNVWLNAAEMTEEAVQPLVRTMRGAPHGKRQAKGLQGYRTDAPHKNT